MLIPVPELVQRYRVRPIGVLHLGADSGQEARAYQRARWQPVWWVEARPDAAAVCQRNLRAMRGHHVICAAMGEHDGEQLQLHVASNGQSSSLLELGTHAVEHPDVTYSGDLQVSTVSLDQLVAEHSVRADFVNVDLQGIELRVLRGGPGFVDGCRWVYSEVNRGELYEGCDRFDELDSWLSDHGFGLRELRMAGDHGWGDALWGRRG